MTNEQRAPILEVRGLTHTYGGPSGFMAIRELNFDVMPGEVVAIVGPSGAGKTTLLRSLSGLMQASGGSVILAGREVRGVPDELAMVFQEYASSLYPWMSVRKNVEFPLLDRGIPEGERQDLVAESLGVVGLAGAATKYPWQLSGGMQQRVAIARALAYRPTVLLMDEPFASVDAQTREGLEDLVLRVRAEFDMTIVLVTHDIDEAVYLSDRVVVLTNSPAEVAQIVGVSITDVRDQISTKESVEFLRARKEVATLIHASRSAESAEPVI